MLVTVEDGRAIDVRGAPDHPPTAGTLCTKVARYLERTYSKERVLYPMRRAGRKGEGRFERIDWDEALVTIAAQFGAIAASPDGPQAILPYSYAGTMGLLQSGSMDRRFFHRLGASLLDRTICATAGKEGWAASIGASMGTDVEQFEHSRLILRNFLAAFYLVAGAFNVIATEKFQPIVPQFVPFPHDVAIATPAFVK